MGQIKLLLIDIHDFFKDISLIASDKLHINAWPWDPY